jgi:hypothetical protein
MMQKYNVSDIANMITEDPNIFCETVRSDRAKDQPLKHWLKTQVNKLVAKYRAAWGDQVAYDSLANNDQFAKEVALLKAEARRMQDNGKQNQIQKAPPGTDFTNIQLGDDERPSYYDQTGRNPSSDKAKFLTGEFDKGQAKEAGRQNLDRRLGKFADQAQRPKGNTRQPR